MNTFKNLIRTILTFALSVSLSACGPIDKIMELFEPEKTIDLGILYQNTSNNSDMNFNDKSFIDSVYDVVYHGGNVMSVIADGDPFVDQDLTLDKMDNLPKKRRQSYAEEDSVDVVNLIASGQTKNNETDILSGIRLLARNLSQSDGEEKSMDIISDGLQTVGDFSFTSPQLIYSDFDYVLDQLESQHALPDLSNIYVKWFMTAPAGKQTKFTSDFQSKLEEFWSKLIERCGSKVKFIYIDTNVECESKHTVSEVVIPALALDVVDKESAPEIVKIDDKSCEFKPDSDQLKNYKKTVKALEPLAKMYISTHQRFYLYGMTANVPDADEKTAIELSLARAKTISDLLINDLHVPKEQIISCIGLGQNPCDLRSQNESDNRAVWVISEDSTLNQGLVL